MIYYTLLIVFFSINIFADDATYYISTDMDNNYGITIKKEYTSNKEERVLKIYQNGKLLANYNDRSFKNIYSGDLDGDGYEEMVFQGFSGGAHCCFDLIITELKPDMPKPFYIDTNNAENIVIRDIDRDKRAEIITYDDQYSYIFGLCFACSPWVQVIANFDGKKLLLRPKLMKKQIRQIKFKPKKFRVVLDEFGNIKLNDNDISPLLSEMLRLWYTGQNKQALKIMKRYLVFEHRAVLKLFLIELVDMMARSLYWDDIRRLNGWKEETACFTDGCTPPEELYEKWQVVNQLFEMYEKR